MFAAAARLFDPFLAALIGTVAAASLLPARGAGAGIADTAATLAILLLFFLHGAKLSRRDVVAGAGKWRLHLAVLAASFVLYPLLGVAAGAIARPVAPTMAPGLVFLSLLPSTVQSSIAFTAIAGGDVAAAIAGASLSNILGIVATPLLAAALMGGGGAGLRDLGGEIVRVGAQLLLPFVAGHLLRPWVGSVIERHRAIVSAVDRGSILLLVYAAFSAAVVEGVWRRTDLSDLGVALALGAAMLAAVLVATRIAARALGWGRADEIVLRFCGSKKSLASGVPLAAAIFPGAQAGVALLPLMMFHQLQLMVCSVLARRYAQQRSAGG